MGKRGPKPEDLSGRTFNMLTAIHRVEKEHPRYIKHFEGVQWFCGCECGNYTVARSADLKSGHTKSCGCLRGKNVQDAEKYKRMMEEDPKLKYRLFVHRLWGFSIGMFWTGILLDVPTYMKIIMGVPFFYFLIFGDNNPFKKETWK